MGVRPALCLPRMGTRRPVVCVLGGLLMVVVSLIPLTTAHVEQESFTEPLFPFGGEQGDSSLRRNDDGSSGKIYISTTFPFFCRNHDSLFVNTNGVISFHDQVSQYYPEPFPLGANRHIVAPFWSDVDTRLKGTVWYREMNRSPDNVKLFDKANEIIRRAVFGQSCFSASWMFIATWYKVPYYGALTPATLNITNTFQAVLVTNGLHSFAIYNYGEIRWISGTAKMGRSHNRRFAEKAQVGVNAGDGVTYFENKHSRTKAIINIAEDSNINTTGRFLFQIDSGCNTEDLYSPTSGSMLGGDIVEISRPCLDETSDIVCRFAGVEVAGHASGSKVRCTSPTVFEVGRVPFSMSIDGGNSFNFNGVFTYLSPEDTDPFVRRIDASDWHHLDSLTITWDTKKLKDYVEYVQILVYAYVEDFPTPGDVKLKPVYNILGEDQVVSYATGSFTFTRPKTPDGFQYTVGAIRVSQCIKQTEGNTLSCAEKKTLPGMWSDIHNLHWLYRVPDSSVWCQKWLKKARSDMDFLTDTEPCPCTLTQASFDTGRFSPHPLCYSPESCKLSKPGAVYCVRADRPSDNVCTASCCPCEGPIHPFGGGQECCYGHDDNILNVAWSSGGGFAQRRHHGGFAPYKFAGRVPYLSHWVADILPMEHCCVFSERFCDEYKRVRPSQTCENYIPPRPASTHGEPHFITLDGVEYTFNGVGEYTMLETCEGSLELQARMAALKGFKATVVTAVAAMQRGKSDQIFVEVSERGGMDVWVRPRNSRWSMLKFEGQIRRVKLEGVIIYQKVKNSGGKSIQVNFDCGVSLTITTRPGLLNVFTSLQEELKDSTRGLYGNWNDDKSDDFERPDGTILPVNAAPEEIHQEFCQKWRIKLKDSLFRYPRGKEPLDYRDRDFIPVFLPPSSIFEEAAFEICGNETRCAFDLAVTLNKSVAHATKDAIDKYTAAVELGAVGVAIGVGDPHLITLDGVEYTFNGVGEYTMLETCEGDLVLQARMAVLKPGDRATAITALAVKQHGKSIIQIQVEVNESGGMDFMCSHNNSKWIMHYSEKMQVELEDVAVYRELTPSDKINVSFSCGVELTVTTTAGLLNVFTTLQEDLKGSTRGLYGNWNGDPNDDFERPDKKIIPVSATPEEIHHNFSQKWQIRPEDSLFRYPEGKGPSDYSDENFVPVFLSPLAIFNETVQELCGNDTQCAFDFAVTLDKDMGRATKGAVDMYKTAMESAAIVTCSVLAAPANGMKEVSRANVGGVANFTCDEEFTLQGESQLVCQENGNWTAEVPTCVAKSDQTEKKNWPN